LGRKVFAFYEGENLVCCPVLFTMALALANNAFESKFTSLAQIYSLIVPPSTDRIRLKWDKEWAQRPVFRDVAPGGAGISQTRAISYYKHRHNFTRLGRTCGYRKKLQFYDLRRGSGNMLNGKSRALALASSMLTAHAEALTAEERRQIMGNRGDVYERYYMPNFVDKDVLAIFLGAPRRDDLIRAVGRLERHEMAPDRLNKAQQKEITNDPDLVSLIKCRDEINSRGSGG
jgi:hypothetical protein